MVDTKKSTHTKITAMQEQMHGERMFIVAWHLRCWFKAGSKTASRSSHKTWYARRCPSSLGSRAQQCSPLCYWRQSSSRYAMNRTGLYLPGERGHCAACVKLDDRQRSIFAHGKRRL